MLSADVLQQLDESVRKFVNANYSFDVRQTTVRSELGYNSNCWKMFAELGWLGISFAEEHGGLGGQIEDTLGVMEQFGSGLVVEPFISTVGLAGTALKAGDNETLKAELFPQIISGAVVLALACEEEQSRGNPMNVALRAVAQGDQFILSGTKVCVLNAPQADYLVVSARTAGELCDEHGITLFFVPTIAVGLSLKSYSTVDGVRAANITFDQVLINRSHVVSILHEGLTPLRAAIEAGILMLGAESIGAMGSLLTKTLEYCKTRKQFGVPIASFQVLQHRLADMYVALERTRALFIDIKERHDTGLARSRNISALKVQISKAGRFIGQQAIQLHGGIAMTDELDVGHYFKRLTVIENFFGNVDYHLRQFSQSSVK